MNWLSAAAIASQGDSANLIVAQSSSAGTVGGGGAAHISGAVGTIAGANQH